MKPTGEMPDGFGALIDTPFGEGLHDHDRVPPGESIRAMVSVGGSFVRGIHEVREM